MRPSDLVIRAAAAAACLQPSDLTGRAQDRHTAWARQRGMYVLRRVQPDFSTSRIGVVFGGRDHTTVLHALSAVKERLAKGPDEAAAISAIMAILPQAQHPTARRLAALDLEIEALDARLAELKAQRDALRETFQ